MATKKELIELLDDIPDDQQIAYCLWTIEDVYKQAEEIKIEITDLEAENILNTVHKQQNAGCGISWEDVEDELYNLKRSKE